MPTYQIKAPDGKTYRIQGPPGASQEDVIAAVLRANPTAGVAREEQVEYKTTAPDGKTYKIAGPAGASPNEVNAAVARQAPTSTKPAFIKPPTKSEAAEAAEQAKMLNENAASLNRMIAEQQRLAKLPGVTGSMREKSEATINEYRKTLEDIKGELDYIKRTGRVVPERSFGEAAEDTLKGLAAGAIRTFAGVPSLLGAIPFIGSEAPGKAAEQAGEEFIRRNLAADESEAAQYSTMAKQARRLSEVAGSVAPAFVTRGTSRLGMAALGERAVPALARTEQAAQLALGMGPGAQQQRQAIEQYEKETGQTVSPVVRRTAQILGAAIGATEILTLDAMMARVPSALRGSLTARLANIAERVNVGGVSPKAAAGEVRALMADIQSTGLGRIGVAGVEEGIQEGTAQFAQNVVEKTMYNPDKDVTEGVAENFIYGAIVGGGVRGLTEMVRKVTGSADLAKKAANDQELINATIRLQDNPQDDAAFDVVVKRMTEAYGFTPEQAARYAEQSLGRARGEEDVSSTITGGTVAGVPDTMAGAVPGAVAGAAEPAGAGRLGDVGTPAGADIVSEGIEQPPLVEPTAEQFEATMPVIEQAFTDSAVDFEENYGLTELSPDQKQQAARIVLQSPEVDPYDAITSAIERPIAAPAPVSVPDVALSPPPVIDVAPVYEAPNMKARIAAATPVVQSALDALQVTVPKNIQGNIARTMAQVAATGEQIDPLAFVQTSVTMVGNLAQPKVAERVAASLPAIPPQVSVDEAAVAPVKSAIQSVTTPPPAPAPTGAATPTTLPTLTQFTAQEAGIAPPPAATPAPTPTAPAPTVEAAPAPTPAAPVVEPAPEPTYTPQQIAENLNLFGAREAANRGYEINTTAYSMFREGVRDSNRDIEPLTDEQLMSTGGPEALQAYKEGMQWGKDRVAEAQAPAAEEVGPEFIPNPLPNDVDEWTKLHVGKTQRENEKLVERRKNAERNAVEVELPISALIGTEDMIGRRALENPSTELPYVEKANGKYYIVDGNHRAAAAALSGATSLRVRLGDLDAFTEPKEKGAPAPAPAPVQPEVPAAPLTLDERVSRARAAAREELAAPVAEEVAPEVDPYEDVLNEVEGSFLGAPDEGVEPEIDEKAYNLLKAAAEQRRAPPEKIMEELEKARDRYAEKAMRYKRGPSAGSLSKDAVSAHIRKLVANWGAKLNIQVIESLDELPPALQDTIIKDDAVDAAGFVSPDGTIYILAQNLDSLGDATATVYHESLGHFGLRALFNERLDKVLREIYRTNKALRDETNAWMKDNPKAYADMPNRELRALEEILAERSEAGRIEASIWAKIGAVIKDFGRRMGIKSDFSENEVRAILAMAHDQIVTGPRQSSTVQGLRYMVSSLWQGGPTDHNKHDSAFIGTGERGKVYGWGHYFSTMREVATEYRKRTTQDRISYGGKAYSMDEAALEDAVLDNLPSSYKGLFGARDLAKARTLVRGILNNAQYYGRVPTREEMLSYYGMFNNWDGSNTLLARFKENKNWSKILDDLLVAVGKGSPKKVEGKLFEVQVKPDPDQFMDWQVPVLEQSEYIKQALDAVGLLPKPVSKERADAINRELRDLQAERDDLADQLRAERTQPNPDSAVLDQLSRQISTIDRLTDQLGDRLKKPNTVTGEDIYRQLTDQLGSDKAASEALLLAGIRGNTYIGDQRIVEEGARNYVVFGDSDITIVNKYARKKGSPKAKVTKGEDEINRGVAQAQMAADMMEMADGLSAAIDGHDSGFFYPAIKEGWTSFNDATREGILGALTSSFIINDLDKGKIPSLRRMKTLESKVRGAQNRLRNNFGKLDRAFTRFVNRKGQRTLGMTMHAARINEFSPSEYSSLEEALRDDGMKKWYENKLKDPNLSKGQQAAYKGRITYREKQIRAVWKLWEELGKQPGGHEIYIRVRNFYSDMYAAMRSEQNQYIKELPIDDEAKNELLAAVDPDNYAEEEGDVNDPHDGVPDSVRPKEYFPFRRYGKYWLTIKGDNIKTGRERHHFESAFARNAFLRKRAKELGVDPQNSEIFDKGNSLEDYQNNLVESSLMLSKLFSVIDKAVVSGNYDTSKYSTPGEALDAMKKELKDKLYQTYLMTLPERSLRRQFIHAEKVTGFSGDVLRNFRNASTQYAIQIPKLQYGSDANKAISEGYAALDGMPVDERASSKTYVDEIVRRLRSAINPEEPNAWVAAISRFSFYEVMTSIASAASQMLSIPISVMPKLNADYGYTAAAAAFMRYSFIPYSFGLPERDADGGYSQVLPSVGTSMAVKNNPVRARAFKEFQDRDLFDASAASSLLIQNNMAHTYSTYNIPAEVLGLAAKAMRLPFTISDVASREISAMMFFDLDYEKNLKNGMKPNEAFDAAIENTVKGIDETIGSHNQFERPRYMVGQIRQLFFLFRMYAVNRTMFGLRMGMQVIRGEKATGRTRAAAAHELTGNLAMVAVLGGAVAMPLLDVICGAIDMILPSLMDDEEEEEFRRQHPYSYNNAKHRFLYEWLPQHFGQPTLPGLDGKQHALADVLRNGIPSELIGANFSSRVSWNGMWIRDTLPGENLGESVVNFLETNLSPGAAISIEFIKALEDVYKGDVMRGLEKIVPGMFRGSLTAERLEKQGAETRKGVKMFTKDEITALQRNFQMLGWAPNEVSDWQRERMAMLSMINAATQERSDLMLARNKALSDPEGSEQTVAEVEADIREFNRLHPLPGLQIEKEDLDKSRNRYLQGELETYRGTQLSPEEMAVLLKYK